MTTTLASERARGLTTIAPQVIEKVATRAAASVPGAHAAAAAGLRSLLAPLVPSTSAAGAPATESGVRLELHLDLEWPAAVESVVQQVADEVRAAVLGLVGIELESIDVAVDGFVHPDRPPRPRVQ